MVEKEDQLLMVTMKELTLMGKEQALPFLKEDQLLVMMEEQTLMRKQKKQALRS